MPIDPKTGRSLEWAAGFLEGEGSFCIMKGNSPQLIVQGSQKEAWPLKKLQEQFGGRIFHPVDAHRVYVWRLRGIEAGELMRALYPLMSPRRQKQIDDALRQRAVFEARPSHRGRGRKHSQEHRDRIRAGLLRFNAQRRAHAH